MNAGLLSPVNAHSNAALNPAGAPNVRWARIGVLAKSTVAMGLPGRAGSAGYRHDGPVRGVATRLRKNSRRPQSRRDRIVAVGVHNRRPPAHGHTTTLWFHVKHLVQQAVHGCQGRGPVG